MMRALCDMDTIQIELTNACRLSCSNCTRFCGHKAPFMLSEDEFKLAVDSMEKFPKMTGFMGGEPLLHPKFEEFCAYAKSKLPKEKLGLWTCLPKGFEHYATTICDTFGHIFINDHTRNDIFHGPVLVAADEIFDDKNEMFYAIDHCWLQNSWSASINQKGAFFCEIAAAMAVLFDMDGGWPVEPGWWWRTPKDFREQIEKYCPMCGCAIPLKRRSSTEGIDDISPGNYERIKDFSLKVKNAKYQIHDLKITPKNELEQQPMAAYKDFMYRTYTASKYGIYLVENDQHFLSPYKGNGFKMRSQTIFEEYRQNLVEGGAKCLAAS